METTDPMPTCYRCGLHLGRHTFEDAEGAQDGMCDICLIGLIADTERVGTSLRISVIRAAVAAAVR